MSRIARGCKQAFDSLYPIDNPILVSRIAVVADARVDYVILSFTESFFGVGRDFRIDGLELVEHTCHFCFWDVRLSNMVQVRGRGIV